MLQKRADLAMVGSKKVLFALGGRHGEVRHATVESLDLVRWRLDDVGWQRMPSMLESRSGLAAPRSYSSLGLDKVRRRCSKMVSSWRAGAAKEESSGEALGSEDMDVSRSEGRRCEIY